MLEAAAQHYREAYARYKGLEITLGLAEIEVGLGNVDRAPSCASCGREARSYSAKVSLLWTRWRAV